MTVVTVIDQNDIADSVQAGMLSQDENFKDKLKDALSFSVPESTQSSRARSSIAQSTLNSAAPNEVDRKVPLRPATESNSRDDTLVNDLSIRSDPTFHTDGSSLHGLGLKQFPMIMS